jgi:hypothetical protein
MMTNPGQAVVDLKAAQKNLKEIMGYLKGYQFDDTPFALCREKLREAYNSISSARAISFVVDPEVLDVPLFLFQTFEQVFQSYEKQDTHIEQVTVAYNDVRDALNKAIKTISKNLEKQ